MVKISKDLTAENTEAAAEACTITLKERLLSEQLSIRDRRRVWSRFNSTVDHVEH